MTGFYEGRSEQRDRNLHVVSMTIFVKYYGLETFGIPINYEKTLKDLYKAVINFLDDKAVNVEYPKPT